LQLGRFDNVQTAAIYLARLLLLFEGVSPSNKKVVEFLMKVLEKAPHLVNDCCQDPN